MGSVSMQSQALSRAERLSAIVDGEAAEHVDAVLGTLSESDRSLWVDYHWVGDVLRSDDLAAVPHPGSAFLRRFSSRLHAEPHIVAPGAVKPRTRLRVTRRALPAFAVAAAAVTLTWIVVPQMQHGGALVAMDAPRAGNTGPVKQIAADTSLTGGQPATLDAAVLRDARLDQYLEAHQQFSPRPQMRRAMPYVRAAASEGR